MNMEEEIDKIAKKYMAENIDKILNNELTEEDMMKEISKRYIKSKDSGNNFEYALRMISLIGNKRFERLNGKVTEINKRITDGVEKWEEDDSIIIYSYLKQGVELIEEINKKYDK